MDWPGVAYFLMTNVRIIPLFGSRLFPGTFLYHV